VHQGSVNFKFEMHQIHSNSMEKYFWKLKNDAQRFLLQTAQPAHSFREAQHKAGLTRAPAHPPARACGFG
jgi:hypothetical protein